MSEVLRSEDRTPIEIALEIDKDGNTTARKLYQFLGLAKGQFSRWAKTNITENPFAEENVDYRGFDINVEGNITQDFQLSATFAKKLSMQGKTEKSEQARDYFIKVEDKLKEIAQNGTGGTPIRLYKNNKWYILTIGDEVYNLAPDEAKIISKAVSAMLKNGVAQIEGVVRTMVESFDRDCELKCARECIVGIDKAALEDKARGKGGDGDE